MATGAAVRQPGQPSTDLALLRRLYENLPPRHVRWRTTQGHAFLTALIRAVDLYQVRACAEALSISSTAIYRMLDRPMPHRPIDWPTEKELRPLLRAWTLRQAQINRGQAVKRTSHQYAAVHRALSKLLITHQLRDIAAILKVDYRILARYTEPPLQDPPQPPG